jgi:hypothetical protein
MTPTKVFVYFNLHKKCFSVKALEGAMKGRVIAHRDNVLLYDATLKVSEAGRQRVIREKCKNVHAGVCGTWDETQYDCNTTKYVRQFGLPVKYNPYVYDSFVAVNGDYPVKQGHLVAMHVNNQRPSVYVGN